MRFFQLRSLTRPIEESLFQQVIKQRQRYKSLKDKHSMRWHPLIIRFAPLIKYSSTATYNIFYVAFDSFVARLHSLDEA
ncbi:hypothetical protein EMCRGX_G012204 [Ephydatia muelleri]